jgi:hypothetical protein
VGRWQVAPAQASGLALASATVSAPAAPVSRAFGGSSSFSSTGGPMSATLTEVKVQFHTLHDDKDHNTSLSMWIKIGSATIAYSEGFANNTRFPDHTDSPVFALGEVDKKITKDQVVTGVKARLRMVTVGDDNWWFKFTLIFKFTDDSTITMNHPTAERFDDDERVEDEFFLRP